MTWGTLKMPMSGSPLPKPDLIVLGVQPGQAPQGILTGSQSGDCEAQVPKH